MSSSASFFRISSSILRIGSSGTLISKGKRCDSVVDMGNLPSSTSMGAAEDEAPPLTGAASCSAVFIALVIMWLTVVDLPTASIPMTITRGSIDFFGAKCSRCSFWIAVCNWRSSMSRSLASRADLSSRARQWRMASVTLLASRARFVPFLSEKPTESLWFQKSGLSTWSSARTLSAAFSDAANSAALCCGAFPLALRTSSHERK